MKDLFKRFFSVQHQFKIDPSNLSKTDHGILLAGIILVVVSLILRATTFFVNDKLKRGLLMRFYHLTLLIGLLEAIWYVLRFENVQFFGSHFVAYLIGLVGVVWLGFILKYWWKVYPAQREKQRKEQVRLKYL